MKKQDLVIIVIIAIINVGIGTFCPDNLPKIYWNLEKLWIVLSSLVLIWICVYRVVSQ